MAMTVPFPGTAQRFGNPPGTYEDATPIARAVDVRMDVAAFIGLTERGPVCTPVVIESWDEFLAHFGETGGGRLLPRCVRVFFENGGRRCVVVRAVNYAESRAACWRLPGVGAAGGAPVLVYARDPGAWGNRLRGAIRFPRPLTGRVGADSHQRGSSASDGVRGRSERAGRGARHGG